MKIADSMRLSILNTLPGYVGVFTLPVELTAVAKDSKDLVGYSTLTAIEPLTNNPVSGALKTVRTEKRLGP